MSKLLDKIKKNSTIKDSAVLDDSTIFKNVDETPTDVYALNIALSGDINGGLKSGLLTLAGKSKHFKSGFSLLMASAYMKKNPDAVLLFYDSEFGSPEAYFKASGIDTARVIHTPIKNVEDLKFDIVQQLEGIERGDKLFILIDSIGNLASIKEATDAKEQKSAQDMSRQKALKSLYRIITPYLRLKDIPMIQIGHTYQTLELYPKDVLSGGTGGMLASDAVWFIGRSQEKDTEGLNGFTFNINIEKSRHVKEKSKIPVTVLFEEGVSRYTGMLDIAMDIGAVVKPSNGWYSRVNLDTGEVEEKKFRAKDTDTKEFWQPVLENETFQKKIRQEFQVAYNPTIRSDEELDSETD